MTFKVMIPEWPVSSRVHALVTLRRGGSSRGPYGDFNLADHVGDRPEDVARNRQALRQQLALQEEPWWLNQVHGTHVLDVDASSCRRGETADGAMTRRNGQPLAVLTADCLPIFIAESQGQAICIVHAGWRGLAAGIIGNAVEQLAVEPTRLCAWIGPGISVAHYAVGRSVQEAFSGDIDAEKTFIQIDEHHWRADLSALAALQLAHCGLRNVYACKACTFEEHENFYSYRREKITGRMASLIWIEP